MENLFYMGTTNNIRWIGRALLDSMASTSMNRKALAAFVCLKAHTPASVLKDWSYKTIAERMGVSVNTAKRYMGILSQNRLVSFGSKNGHSYLFLSSLRNKAANKKVSSIDFGRFVGCGIREIEKLISAQYAIVETQLTKEFVKQTINIKETDRFDTIKTKVRKRQELSCGENDFIDNGISTRFIARKLKCGLNKAQKVIYCGLKYRLYRRIVPERIQVHCQGIASIVAAIGGVPDNRYSFYTRNNLYIQPAAKYCVNKVSALIQTP